MFGKARIFFQEGLASFGLPLLKKGEQRRRTEKISVSYSEYSYTLALPPIRQKTS